jgi:hypothetical protein
VETNQQQAQSSQPPQKDYSTKMIRSGQLTSKSLHRGITRHTRLVSTDPPVKRSLTSRLGRSVGWLLFLGLSGYAAGYALDRDSPLRGGDKIVLGGTKRTDIHAVEESFAEKAKEKFEQAEEAVVHVVEVATSKVMEAVDGVTHREKSTTTSASKTVSLL